MLSWSSGLDVIRDDKHVQQWQSHPHREGTGERMHTDRIGEDINNESAQKPKEYL